MTVSHFRLPFIFQVENMCLGRPGSFLSGNTAEG